MVLGQYSRIIHEQPLLLLSRPASIASNRSRRSPLPAYQALAPSIDSPRGQTSKGKLQRGRLSYHPAKEVSQSELPLVVSSKALTTSPLQTRSTRELPQQTVAASPVVGQQFHTSLKKRSLEKDVHLLASVIRRKSQHSAKEDLYRFVAKIMARSKTPRP